MTVLLLALAGGAGAAVRFVVDGLVRSKLRTALPLGTILINVSGSLLLGFLAGLVMRHLAPESLQVVLGTGFLGGYTTFSTASLETVRLVQAGRTGLALANGIGTMGACVLAAAGGAGLASLL
ncbi:fluoride efflux transporter CrcB [Arthrobacter sp. CJ23]|uniref:fluoride efflux transporter CrcB n=1 Tax=Arthrobacter sp. CJ23 TaxID=2972479 RepID=UPI00215CC578|nr:fluoride efflux transporter CrcB [Arthrobacter sp. CJ23]UVJ38470.1 fluoride efflux transporter CrcB [Arthrobacter sp. CJ23]